MHKKFRTASVVCTIANGNTTSGDVEFEKIHGNVVGVTATVRKDDTDTVLMLAVKENASEVARPIPVELAETKGRSSWKDSFMDIKIDNPGNITAVINSDIATKNEVKVAVVILYELNS